MKLGGIFTRKNIPHLCADKAEEKFMDDSHGGTHMFKTIALFFVLGLMVSCASHRNSRTISSFDEKLEKQPTYERSLR